MLLALHKILVVRRQSRREGRVLRLEYTVEQLESDGDGVLVRGHCWGFGFGIGDVFTELQRLRYELAPISGQFELAGTDVWAVVLRVEELRMSGHLVSWIDGGGTGRSGVLLRGPGVELLRGLERSQYVFWTLVGR